MEFTIRAATALKRQARCQLEHQANEKCNSPTHWERDDQRWIGRRCEAQHCEAQRRARL